MSKTEDTLRARFKAACAERDAILAKSMPLREKRDGILRKAQDIEKKAEAVAVEIRTAEVGLYDLNNEIATISRALKGQTA